MTRCEQLLGKVAIANAKLAYQSFNASLGVNAGKPWRHKAHGCSVRCGRAQAPKTPCIRTLYVEPLIGPHTVNTMPDETIVAFADHGKVMANTIEADLEEARHHA